MDIAEFGYDSDLKFCEDLARLVGVGAVPGSSFFREPVNHLIRFHFAKKDETLLNALTRLESLRSKNPIPQKELKETALKREALQEQGVSVSCAARNPRCPRLQRYDFPAGSRMGATPCPHGKDRRLPSQAAAFGPLSRKDGGFAFHTNIVKTNKKGRIYRKRFERIRKVRKTLLTLEKKE